MIIKDENKSKSKTRSKILVLGLILFFILAGFFSPATRVNAEENPVYGTCTSATGKLLASSTVESICHTLGDTPETNVFKPIEKTEANKPKSEFELQVEKWQCGLNGLTPEGCMLRIVYVVFYSVPALFLWIVGNLFNELTYISLNGDLLKDPFVLQAWGVVRDLSNIFFILILLYIAIKIILDLGGAEAKKMIVKVIVVALLINFSMFFTKVVIDSSNILALIFYNKLEVVGNDGQAIQYSPLWQTSSSPGEKDLAGGMVAAFDPTTKLNNGFFENLQAIWGGTSTDSNSHSVGGQVANVLFFGPIGAGINAYHGIANAFRANATGDTPVMLLIGITIMAGLLMYCAAWVILVAALAFLVRIIELWVLIIFSPFAFMSSAVPKFAGMQYLGWTYWFKRLLQKAFMAPIFMFFLYFIFMLIQSNIFKGFLKTSTSGPTPTQAIKVVLMMVLPLLLIVFLLYRASKFATSDKIGEWIMAAVGAVVAVVVAAISGGASLALSATVGGLASKVAGSGGLKAAEAKGGLRGFGAKMLLRTADYSKKASFDIRKAPGVATLAGKAGINVGKGGLGGMFAPTEGGFEQRKKEQVEKRQKRAQELHVGEEEKLKQDLNKTEMDLQELMSVNAQVIETLDKNIEKKREEVAVANNKLNAARGTDEEDAAKTALKEANRKFDIAKENKKDFREGRDYMMEDSTGAVTLNTGTGANNIHALEEQKRDQTQAITTENARRNRLYAQTQQSAWNKVAGYVLSGGAYNPAAAREAAHKIIMETKLDSGTKT